MSDGDVRRQANRGDFPATPGACPPAWTPAALAALDTSLRRQLLRRGDDVYSVQSHLDAAEIVQATGSPAAARLLCVLAFLRLGFSPAASRHQIAIARRTRLWSTDTVSTWPDGPVVAARFMPGTAIVELRRVMACPVALPAPAQAPAAAARPDVSADCEALCDVLRSPATPGTIAALTMLLGRLERDYLDAPFVALADHAGDPPDALIDAFARHSLRQFLQRHHRLAFPPLGSVDLLHEAGRLDPAGLGAFFANVPCVVRGPEDLFGLVHAAAGGIADDDLLDRWVVILAIHLDPHRLHGLVDLLGDLQGTRALWSILTLAARDDQRRRDHPLMFALRDAGLDMGDMRLAAEAQRIVAIDRRDAVLEWRILGEIHATAGEAGPARRAFAQGLRCDPGDKPTARRIKALDDDTFAPFAVRSGFGEHSRARRRGALNPDPPDAAYDTDQPGTSGVPVPAETGR